MRHIVMVANVDADFAAFHPRTKQCRDRMRSPGTGISRRAFTPPPSGPRPLVCSWLFEMKLRAFGHDTCWVDGGMGIIVMLFDMSEIRGVAEGRHGVQAFQVSPQVWHVANAIAVAFEMAVIDRVETDQRCIEANIGLCQPFADQKRMLRKPRFDRIQRGKQRIIGFFISLLRSGKAAAIDAVVDVVINKRIDRIDFFCRAAG